MHLDFPQAGLPCPPLNSHRHLHTTGSSAGGQEEVGWGRRWWWVSGFPFPHKSHSPLGGELSRQKEGQGQMLPWPTEDSALGGLFEQVKPNPSCSHTETRKHSVLAVAWQVQAQHLVQTPGTLVDRGAAPRRTPTPRGEEDPRLVPLPTLTRAPAGPYRKQPRLGSRQARPALKTLVWPRTTCGLTARQGQAGTSAPPPVAPHAAPRNAAAPD